jgi:hypothetical protein
VFDQGSRGLSLVQPFSGSGDIPVEVETSHWRRLARNGDHCCRLTVRFCSKFSVAGVRAAVKTVGKRYDGYMSLSREISEKGQAIYRAKYMRRYGASYFGQYLAIDLETTEAFVAPSATAAMQKAQIKGKTGALVYLFRIGHKARGNPEERS